MDSEKIMVVDKINDCISKDQNFVLQGGAGSGKTETLKQVLEHISENYPGKKVVCITHTNLAVDEIVSRVGNEYTISTIHSFLNSFIKNYKRNIHQVIFEIFKIEKIERKDITEYKDEKEQKAEEHKNYKKIYEKYANKIYTVKGEGIAKVIGKREYEKSPEGYNEELNSNIDVLNELILKQINETDYNIVGYNDTRFDSLKDLTFGHDSLISIALLLFQRYPLLSKILQDKYDFILIDEYQDTHGDIIEILLELLPKDSKTIVGLFGDSMQGIYEDGIGDVEKYIADERLIKIEKEDNYRCSEQVVKFINTLRNDGLEQEVEFKTKNGVLETIEDRQGEVKFYYAVYNDPKPHVRSAQEDKEKYLDTLKSLINKVEEKHPNFKKLMLTNKSISQEIGFENLYSVCNNRYSDVKDEIEKCLTRIQLLDLIELAMAYENKNYNLILTKIKKSGFELKTIADKKRVSEILDGIKTSSKGAIEILELAFEHKLIKKTDSYLAYLNRKDTFIKELGDDEFYTVFKKQYEEGKNTFNRMNADIPDLENEKFNDYEKLYKKERFYLELFSEKINFSEIYKYFNYLNEETDYITMHKTKGSGIKDVLVVLDEYFWNKYNFKTIFNPNENDLSKKLYNQKLFYVSCSRAIKNLVCVRLITEEEKEFFLEFFPHTEKIIL
ncbi:DNA and RNA helicase family protein [Tenacibaculum maritimum]|uniref:UvrD-helicase domain-containing protein n=1 Tax=Tenacibaculum maritimum TaxID=107401 RepID=UPI0012E6EEF7|nr:UvrD-helicase domain-containing protein [Tenacibaculum maritimum]CAA0170167.1 DNA and RNA helicase family protein [Tenacibaculum maritimum]